MNQKVLYVILKIITIEHSYKIHSLRLVKNSVCVKNIINLNYYE